MNKTYITGVDQNLAHFLPWWIENIRRHDKETHITVCDYGMKTSWQSWLKTHVNHVLTYPPHPKCAWYWKPHSLLEAPYKYKCWIDIDCEVLDNMSEIFNYADKAELGLTVDPCRRKEVEGEKWLATGVNVIKNKPKIVEQWAKECITSDLRGDQEVLHEILKREPKLRKKIVEMDPKYQWLRLQLARGLDNPDKKLIHWSGPDGKRYIDQQIRK